MLQFIKHLSLSIQKLKIELRSRLLLFYGLKEFVHKMHILIPI
jgi:hypothetical protein